MLVTLSILFTIPDQLDVVPVVMSKLVDSSPGHHYVQILPE